MNKINLFIKLGNTNSCISIKSGCLNIKLDKGITYYILTHNFERKIEKVHLLLLSSLQSIVIYYLFYKETQSLFNIGRNSIYGTGHSSFQNYLTNLTF